MIPLENGLVSADNELNLFEWNFKTTSILLFWTKKNDQF